MPTGPRRVCRVVTMSIGAGIATATIAPVAAGANDLPSGGARYEPPAQRARLARDGLAVAPASAPAEVVAVIRAANRIAHKPYRYGGGHGSWRDNGYDCSGSISFALHAAGLLRRPLASGPFMHWGARGRGRWISIRANLGHAYMIVAGLRFDTSARKRGGSRWTKAPRSVRGYRVTHPVGF